MDQRQALLRPRRAAHEPVADLNAFAQELHRRCVGAAREALGQALARCDRAVPPLEIAGARYHRVLRCATTSISAVGPVRGERSLYRQRHGGGRAVCPLDLRAGIIAGDWPPLAAQQATWVVAQLTPPDGEELFALLGNMPPSKRTVERFPTQRSVRWAAQASAL